MTGADAVTLHALRLVGGQHGVVAVSVIVGEDGVVAPQRHIPMVGDRASLEEAA